MKMEYFGIRVTDLEASLKFYTTALGLQEVMRGDMTEHGRGRWIVLRDPASGQQLELNWYHVGSRFATPYSPGEGLDHIGFLVEDVSTAYSELLSKGAKGTEVTPESTEGWQAYLEDPDGNWIELFRK